MDFQLEKYKILNCVPQISVNPIEKFKYIYLILPHSWKLLQLKKYLVQKVKKAVSLVKTGNESVLFCVEKLGA